MDLLLVIVIGVIAVAVVTALAERLDLDALKRQFGARRIGFTRALPMKA